MRIDVYHHLAPGFQFPELDVNHRLPGMEDVSLDEKLQKFQEALMSQITDAINALKTSVDNAVSRVQGDVSTLNAKIAELQAKVDAGLATPEDMAALADIRAKVDAIDPTSEVILPTP